MGRKILLVRATPNDLDIKGYNVQQVGLGKEFVKHGYDYDFVTFKKNINSRNELVFFEYNNHKAKCIELPRMRFFRWGINIDICDKGFLDQYDLIICQEYYQLQSFLVSRKSNRVVLYNGPYYNLFMPKWFSPIFDKIIGPRLDKQIKIKFVKSFLSEEFLRQKGYTGLKNIGVGLDIDRFDDEITIKPETQELIDYMKNNRCILYVGALSDRKNYPFLLEIYKKVLQTAPDVKFVMIGKSVVSAFAKFIGIKDEAYAAKYYNKLPEHVRSGIKHVPRIENPQLKYIYPLAKAFLLPSKLEIFGMVLLEAMYLKTPVISSRNGGSVTLIQGRNTGQIIDQFDVDLWCDAVMKYLNNPSYVHEITENAAQLIKEKYNWEVLALKFLEVIPMLSIE